MGNTFSHKKFIVSSHANGVPLDDDITGSSTTNLGLNFSKQLTTTDAADSEYNTPTFTAEISKSSNRDSICSLTSFSGNGNTSLIPVVF